VGNGVPKLNVIFEKSKVKLSNLETMSCPTFPYNSSISDPIFTVKMGTFFRVATGHATVLEPSVIAAVYLDQLTKALTPQSWLVEGLPLLP
jgi:hypothetical protein